jgi:hypothetical protein
MASAEVIEIEGLMQNRVRVHVEVRTSVGRSTFPVDIPNQGSREANELEAFLEVQKLLTESLNAVRQRLASKHEQ